MARRGTFGHQPRATPDLTSTIIAIAREMLAQEDTNIMTAWTNGGQYEGKPVTDSMVLAHWKDRMAGLSSDDPQYDEYKNNYLQLQYNIAQSKAATEYAQSPQGAADDQKMANFYLGWAKKIPKDSNFYRELQQDAAKFLTTSSSKARANAAKAKQDAFNAFTDDTNRRYIGLGETLTQVMVQVARDNNLIGQNQDLSDFALQGENDPGRMENLLSMINTDMHANPAQYASLVAAVKQYDPNWDGNLTSGYFASALKNQVQGYSIIQARATTDGYTSQATAAGKSLTAANTLGAEVQSWPVASAYSIARAQFDAVWNSPAATDADKAAAANTFATAVEGFGKTPGLDTAMANRLLNDAASLRGDPNAVNQPSFYESYLGTSNLTAGSTNVSGSVKGENANFSMEAQRIDFWKQQYDANPGAYVYAPSKLDSQGNPTYDPTGDGPVGVVPVASVSTAPGANTTIPVPLITGGSIMEVVSVKDITFEDPFGGAGTVVGKSLTYNWGGVTVTLYGMSRPDGTMDWTPVSPVAQGVNETIKPDGIHLTVSQAQLGMDNAAIAAAADESFGTNVADSFANGAVPTDGMSWTSRADANGYQIDHTVTWKNGQLVYTTKSTALDANGKATGNAITEPAVPVVPITSVDVTKMVWDQARLTAGPNPQIDFTTPAMAALVTSGATGSAAFSMWNNPQFQAQLQAQESALSGGDPLKLQQAAALDSTIAGNLAAFGPAVKLVFNLLSAGQKTLNAQKSAGAPNVMLKPSIVLGHELTVPTYNSPEQPTGGVGLLETGSDMLRAMGLNVPSAANLPVTQTKPYSVAPAGSVTPTPAPAPMPTGTATPAVAPAPAPLPAPGAPVAYTSMPQFRVPTVPKVDLPTRKML